MTACNSQNCAEVIDFSRHVGKRCKEPADPFAGRSRRSGGGKIGGLSARTSRAHLGRAIDRGPDSSSTMAQPARRIAIMRAVRSCLFGTTAG